MKIKDKFVVNEIVNQLIVMSSDPSIDTIGEVMVLSESGYFLWKCLQEDTTSEVLIHKLILEYGVSLDVAEKDVEDFINNLKDLDILE